MKAKEAQLLGVLALVATGIVFAGLWAGSEPGAAGKKSDTSAQKNASENATKLAQNTGSQPSSSKREDWLKSSDNSSSQPDTSPLNQLAQNSSDGSSFGRGTSSNSSSVDTEDTGGGLGSNTRVLEEMASDTTEGSRQAMDTSAGSGSDSGSSREVDLSSPSGSSLTGTGTDSTPMTGTDREMSSDSSASDGSGSAGQIELGGSSPASPGSSGDDEKQKQDSIEQQDRQISATLANKKPKEVGVVKQDELGSGESADNKTTSHTVKEGETLAAISRQYYGVSGHWRRIMKANPMVLDNPRALQPGMKLTIPSTSDSSSSAGSSSTLPEPTGPGLKEGPNGESIYRVQKGDTLYSIAEEYYGDGSLWRHILNKNSDIMDSPQDLRPGKKLIMP